MEIQNPCSNIQGQRGKPFFFLIITHLLNSWSHLNTCDSPCILWPTGTFWYMLHNMWIFSMHLPIHVVRIRVACAEARRDALGMLALLFTIVMAKVDELETDIRCKLPLFGCNDVFFHLSRLWVWTWDWGQWFWESGLGIEYLSLGLKQRTQVTRLEIRYKDLDLIGLIFGTKQGLWPWVAGGKESEWFIFKLLVQGPTWWLGTKAWQYLLDHEITAWWSGSKVRRSGRRTSTIGTLALGSFVIESLGWYP